MPGRNRGAVALGSVALGATSLLGACAGDDGAAGAPESPSPSTVQEGPVAATAVAVGDCLNGVVIGAAERATISSADVVSCDRAHGLEVYATFTLQPDDFGLTDPAEYPGPARVVRAADERCAERIEQVVEDPGAFGLIALWPSQESWAAGDRTVACAVFSPDGSTFEARQI
ncbi:septum formation family protein [Acidimicrobiia bacterium EGI L10123]|uniref:septum formation family protein n=1 Tax=Salinilacustrithrix flava TaxID=2957203 RepID=UPI003D7C1550|nr:septum formation family protein [Acidimicrobiia bacterium EGI L10123]